MANKIRLVVGGIEYYINTEDDEAYVQKLGDELNRHLDELMKKNPFLSTTMAAVLAALEYCDESKKAKIDAENLRAQMKSYIEDAGTARLEADEARREIERLNKENQALRARLVK
ncbi:MAG: hypothetical protein BGN88_04830 [Clostridiales bacterium 43-6]|nr:MAG: hypothetical protein BGN88_04830 [Clostridiales bacterium 43-6]